MIDDIAKAALQETINRWKLIATGDGDDLEMPNPLCDLYFKAGTCKGCPISDFTQARQCEYTPFHEWEDCFATADEDEPHIADTDEKKEAAINMVSFLEKVYDSNE